MQFTKYVFAMLFAGAVMNVSANGLWNSAKSAVSHVNFDTVKSGVSSALNSTAFKVVAVTALLNSVDDYTGGHTKAGLKNTWAGLVDRVKSLKVLFETRENIATTVAGAALLALFGAKSSSLGDKIPDIACKAVGIAGLSTVAGKVNAVFLNKYVLNKQKEDFKATRNAINQALQSSSDDKIKPLALPDSSSLEEKDIMKYTALTMAGMMTAWAADEHVAVWLKSKK